MDLVKRQKTCNAKALSSYSAFASLGDDMLTEILCRLPCKSAHQFKCVCRHWFFIISGSNFIQRFLSIHPQPPPFALLIKCYDRRQGQEKLKFLVTSKDPEFQPQEFSLSFLPCFKPDERESVKIIASCNGLLLCCAETEACPTVYHRGKEACAGLICENDSNQYGYRVVCVVNTASLNNVYSTVKIISSETGKWTETIHSYQIQDSTRWIKNLNNMAIVCKGMLYWWSRFDGGFITCDRDGNLKLSLGMQRLAGQGVCAGVCMGRFCLGQISSESQNPSDFVILRVWHLEDREKGQWCLKHEIPLNKLKSEITQLVNYANSTYPALLPFQFLSFHPYNEDIIYLSFPYSVVSCNLERRTLEIVSEIPSENIYYLWCLAYQLELPWWPSPFPSSLNLSDSDIKSV